MLTDYEKIMSWLEDEESRYIYKKRMEYREKGNFKAIQEIIDKYLPECRDMPYQSGGELKLVKMLKDKDKIIIFGAGVRGRRVLKLLQNYRIKVDAIVDNDSKRWGMPIKGFVVEPPDRCDYSEACCIVSPIAEEVTTSICSQLLDLGAKEDNIFKYTDYRVSVVALEDKQYFDEKVIHFEEGEVFIDAGVFNLCTSKNFVKKCKENNIENYKIYAFEPDKDSYEKCRKILSEMEDVDIELHNYGLWREKATLYFENDGSGSRITSEKTDTYVNVVSLDSFVKNNVTFIKMDIEGAELEALMGGAEIIKKYRPKLAISIYHKDEDLTEIPLFIKELVPEYKLYIRHYSNMTNETVLYAVL